MFPGRRGNNMWVVHYRPDKVSQPWSILGSFDEKVDAIIKAYQVSSEYFMIKVIDPDGNIIWSTWWRLVAGRLSVVSDLKLHLQRIVNRAFAGRPKIWNIFREWTQIETLVSERFCQTVIVCICVHSRKKFLLKSVYGRWSCEQPVRKIMLLLRVNAAWLSGSLLSFWSAVYYFVSESAWEL